MNGNLWLTIGMIAVVVVVFYFFMIRPQKKREKEANEMRDNLRVGDEITTIGGIVGKVVSVREETFVLETTKDKTHIRFLRAAIRSVDVRAEDSVDPTKKAVVEEQPTKGKKGKKKAKPAETAPTAVEETIVESVSENAAPATDAPAEEVAVNVEVETVEAISESNEAKEDK